MFALKTPGDTSTVNLTLHPISKLGDHLKTQIRYPKRSFWIFVLSIFTSFWSSGTYIFSSLLESKEGWMLKNWCFWIVVLKTLESPLDFKEIQPVHPKGEQSWMFIGRTDVEAETPILWPPDAKSWLIWKDSDAGKDCRQEEKGTAEGEMVGWHHQLNRHEFG